MMHLDFVSDLDGSNDYDGDAQTEDRANALFRRFEGELQARGLYARIQSGGAVWKGDRELCPDLEYARDEIVARMLEGRADPEGNLRKVLRAAFEITCEQVRLRPAVEALERAARRCLFPPALSAVNHEVCAMSFAYFWTAAGALEDRFGPVAECCATKDGPIRSLVLTYVCQSSKCEKLQSVATRFKDWLSPARGEDWEGLPQSKLTFIHNWPRAAYARVEVGHRLAASLCLTDAPEHALEPPWPAWALVVPDGLLGDIARVWVVGVEPAVAVSVRGESLSPRQLSKIDAELLRNLVRGCCLALGEPSQFRRTTKRYAAAGGSRRADEPDFLQDRLLLRAPIEVDLRDQIAAIRSARGHSRVPHVQFLVRGHWRNQACGTMRHEHRRIWIRPFWKGPEGSRILMASRKLDPEA